MCPVIFIGHPENFEVKRAEKSTILTQIERFFTVIPV